MGILKSIERSKGRGYLYAVFMAGLPASLCGGLVCLLPAFYQPSAGWLAGGLKYILKKIVLKIQP
ncbi:MAG TPA: hypothetical protein PK874_12830 [Desulfobacteraceae bacterium]|nr:hypothetical protein [Desulfobacteraceae bacterium]HPJ67283.1 hypothetical protein [Desulfobacteraceae bacterium]